MEHFLPCSSPGWAWPAPGKPWPVYIDADAHHRGALGMPRHMQRSDGSWPHSHQYPVLLGRIVEMDK